MIGQFPRRSDKQSFQFIIDLGLGLGFDLGLGLGLGLGLDLGLGLGLGSQAQLQSIRKRFFRNTTLQMVGVLTSASETRTEINDR